MQSNDRADSSSRSAGRHTTASSAKGPSVASIQPTMVFISNAWSGLAKDEPRRETR
jgi:hypothetical protein